MTNLSLAFYPIFLTPKLQNFLLLIFEPCLLYCPSCFRIKCLKLIAYLLPLVVYVRVLLKQ